MLERYSDQRGEGRVGFLVTLAVFGIMVFLAVKIIPVRIDAYQFRELLREEARYASVNKEDKEITTRILERAREMEIPLESGDLDIRRTQSEVIISAVYEKPVDLKVTTYTYKFNAEQRAPLF